MKIDLHINLNVTGLDHVIQLLFDIKHQGERIVAKLEDIQADVQQESSLIDGVSTLVQGLKQQISDALKNAGISAEVQKQIDDVFAQVESNKQKLTQALADNTPAANVPVDQNSPAVGGQTA